MYDRAGLKRHNWEHISRNFIRARRILEQETADVEITLAGVIFMTSAIFTATLKSMRISVPNSARAFFTEAGK
jgi:hypothetical protein